MTCICLIFLFLSQAPITKASSSSIQQDTNNKKNPTAHLSSPNNQPNSETANSQSEQISTQIAEKTSQAPDSSRRDDFNIGLASLLVVVGFLQALVLYRQANIAERQETQMIEAGKKTEAVIAQMKDTAQRDLRAYVLPAHASRQEENGGPRLRVTLFNSGQTPALNCRTEVFRGIGPMVKPLPPLPATTDSKASESLSFIGANSDTWAVDIPDPISKEEEQYINQGVRGIYVIGTVSYEDVFGKKHLTRYRLVCTGKDGLDAGTFVFCDEGNSAD